MSRILAMCIALLGCAQLTIAQCHAPRYRKGRDYGATVHVSIAPSEFSLVNLACLSEKLHAQRGRSQILFFTSQVAAANFTPAKIETPPPWKSWAADLHAGYFFESGTAFLEIYPFGYEGDSSQKSRLDLPLLGSSHCREEFAGRCVIVLAGMSFPSEALEKGNGGSIVLSGTINKDGQINGIRVVKNGMSEEKDRSLFANVAIQNFARWRMDSQPREDSVQITYSFVVDSAHARESTEIKWELPDRVVVIGHRGHRN
jgi:Gram-negative bacterial TonB protein C-terminal